MMNEYKHKDCLTRLLNKSVDDYVAKSFKDQDRNSPVILVLKTLFNEQHNSYINQILFMNDDVVAHDDVKRYMRIAKSLGFCTVSEFPFISFDGKDLTHDYMYLLWREENNILLKIETMQDAKLVARAAFYYNWQTNSGVEYAPHIFGDGHYAPSGVWIGENDATEALKHKLILMSENGHFVTPWVKAPYISFKSYAERKQKDEIVTQRIESLPKKLRNIIT